MKKNNKKCNLSLSGAPCSWISSSLSGSKLSLSGAVAELIRWSHELIRWRAWAYPVAKLSLWSANLSLSGAWAYAVQTYKIAGIFHRFAVSLCGVCLFFQRVHLKIYILYVFSLNFQGPFSSRMYTFNLKQLLPRLRRNAQDFQDSLEIWNTPLSLNSLLSGSVAHWTKKHRTLLKSTGLLYTHTMCSKHWFPMGVFIMS